MKYDPQEQALLEFARYTWDQNFKGLQETYEFLYWASDRKFHIAKGGVIGTFHLWEEGRSGLHLMDAYYPQVDEFLEDNAPKMFRFYNQSQDWTWLNWLRAFWFSPDAATSRSAYKECHISFSGIPHQYNFLPVFGGVYVVTEDEKRVNEDPQILYVGSSRSIQGRWKGKHHRLDDMLRHSPYLRIHCFNRTFFQYDLKRMEKLIGWRLKPIYSKRIG